MRQPLQGPQTRGRTSSRSHGWRCYRAQGLAHTLWAQLQASWTVVLVCRSSLWAELETAWALVGVGRGSLWAELETAWVTLEVAWGSLWARLETAWMLVGVN